MLKRRQKSMYIVHALQKPIERKHTSQTTSNINWNWGGFVPLLLPADTGRILIQPRSTVLWPVRCGGVIPRQMWRNSDWSWTCPAQWLPPAGGNHPTLKLPFHGALKTRHCYTSTLYSLIIVVFSGPSSPALAMLWLGLHPTKQWIWEAPPKITNWIYRVSERRSVLTTLLCKSDKTVYDTVSDVVESEVHQCQQNSDA